MAKKWTKAEREAASIAGKKRWAARKLGATATKYAPSVPITQTKNDQCLATAIDVIDLIAGHVPPGTMVRVVERILRP